MIGIIFAILGFLASGFGIMCILIGLVLFLTFPLISTASRFKKPANLFLSLATFPLKRAAVVISEHDDALFKQMEFSGLGVELITIDDEEKAFEDPDNALHHFLGIPFALADEEHGVLFDPRHAAAGMRKRLKDKRNEATYLASEAEWEEFGVAKWMPGVFELPQQYEMVDLSAVQELIPGGERSEYAKRVEEIYKHSRDPFSDGVPASQFLYPMIGMIGPFAAIWVLSSQLGFGGGGGPTSTVGYGSLLWLLINVPRKDIDWKKWAGLGLMILVPLAIVSGIFLFFGLVLTVAVLVAVTIGFILLPILTFLSQPSKLLSGGLSKLYFKLGFFGYREPVITWTQSKYEVREWDTLDHTDNVHYYDLFGHTVGFSYEPGPESWNGEPVKHSEIESQQPVADGGQSMDSDLPAKYVRSSQMQRDSYGCYLPKRVRDSKYYINAGMVLERMLTAANGDKSLKKLLEAKEVHGSASAGMDDSTVVKLTAVLSVISFIAGLGVFILPAFL